MKKIFLSCFLIIFLMMPLVHAALTDNVVHVYSFDTDGSDDVGTNDLITVSGATHTTTGCKLGGGCFSFDGINDYLNTSANFDFDFADSWSISVWSNQTTGAINKNIFQIGVGMAIAKPNSFKLLADSVFSKDSAGTNVKLYTNAPTPAGWSYRVITWNGGLNTLKFYHEGTDITNTLTHSINGTGTMTNTTRPMLVGAASNTGSLSDFFDGLIDEIVIWNRVLTDSEIAELNNSGDGLAYPFAGTVTITQSTYNVTSALNVGNRTLWATNTSNPVHLTDSTPTVKFTASETSNCTIGTVDQNYTDMLAGDSNRKCGTTDVTAHTCTLPTTDKLTASNQNLYISCVGSSGNEGATSTSGALATRLLGVVAGYVLDSSGTTIANATVYIINQTGDVITETLTSNSSGQYTTNLLIGNYTLVGYDKLNVSRGGSVKPHVQVLGE